MDVIDIAIVIPAAEALILGNVQRALRALSTTMFSRTQPLPFSFRLGSQQFRRILQGQIPNPLAVSPQDPLNPTVYTGPIPFYITSIDMVNAVLTPRSMAPIGTDERTAFDDVERPASARLTVLVPSLSGSVTTPNLEALALPGMAASGVVEAGLAVTLALTVQNEEGWDGRVVTSVTEMCTAFVVFDVQRDAPPLPYALRLVPRIVNLRFSVGVDLLTQIREAARRGQLLDPELLGLRALLDTINQQIAASGAMDLNDIVKELAGDAIFAPNAALLLTTSQLRLRVQLERRSLWFDQPPGGDPSLVADMRALQRTVVMTEWTRILTAPANLSMPMGSALALQVPPLVILERVNGALLDAFDHSDPMGGIPKVIRDLVATLAEEGIPRTLVPLSDIRLEHEYVDLRVTTPEAFGGAPHYTWSWTLGFIDVCPVTESDIDIDFMLRVGFAAEAPLGTPSGRVGSTPQTDLVFRGRLDFDIDNLDLVRCALPFALAFAAIVVPLLAAVPLVGALPLNLLGVILAPVGLAIGGDAIDGPVRRALGDAISEGLPDVVRALLPIGLSGEAVATLGLDFDGLSFSVRVTNVLPDLVSPAAFNGRVLRTLAPLGFDGGGEPTLSLQVAGNGVLSLTSTLPSRPFVVATLAAARNVEATRAAAWRAERTVGAVTAPGDSGRKFVWLIDGRCRFVDSSGNLIVPGAHFEFSLTALGPLPMRVFSVRVISSIGLQRNLTMQLAVSGAVLGPMAVPDPTMQRELVIRPDQRLDVTFTASVGTVAARIGVPETLLVVVSTNVGRFVLSMDRPFERLAELLPLILRPSEYRAEIDALRERCQLGRPIGGTTIGTGRRPGMLPATGDIASMLLGALGPIARFGEGDLRERLGLGLPREIINPLAHLYDGAYAQDGALGADAFRFMPDAVGALYDARDIAGQVVRTRRD